jgi:hypothetical protein
MKVLFAVAGLMLAADSKEDAQKKVDEAMAKSCELAKKNVENNKEACADQAKAFEALDCASKESRKAVDFLKVQGECLKKVKETAKAGAPAEGAAGGPAGSGEKKKGSHCKVMDEAGAVLLEHDSEGTTIKCQGEIREKVKAEKCEPGKKLALQYVGESAPGKEGKPSAMNISCPKK